MTVSIRWHSVVNFLWYIWFLKQNSLSPGISIMWSVFFVLLILPEILRISFKFQFSYIKPKLSIFERSFFKFPIILKAQKARSHYGNAKIREFVLINSRNLLLRLILRINVANYFKDQKRHSNRLATVMFCGTPCIWLKNTKHF